jgi:hypothetical protein
MILLQLFDGFVNVVKNAKDWKRVFAENLYKHLNGLGSQLKLIIKQDAEIGTPTAANYKIWAGCTGSMGYLLRRSLKPRCQDAV